MNKPQMYAPAVGENYLRQLSKAALIDIAWNLALLGTNETDRGIMARLMEEVDIVCKGRGDRLPRGHSPELIAKRQDPYDPDGLCG